MQNKSLEKYYDQEWSDHDVEKHDKSNLRAYQKEALSYAFQNLKNHFGSLKNKKVLEIGPGKGYNLSHFAKLGCRVTGVDISKNSLRLSKKLFDKHGLTGKFMQMDAHNLKFKNEFDVVFLQTTLMHLDALQIADQCKKVLKKNGVFLFIEPSADNIFVKFYRVLFSKYKETNPKYLGYNQVVKISKYFSNSTIKGFYLFSFFSLVFKNKILFNVCSFIMKGVENILLFIFPIFGKKAWLWVSFNIK
jgi:2-polyprenyl-3-methyl-5-hydroxy-6-metoxy-1,4-benzoquinol methylase